MSARSARLHAAPASHLTAAASSVGLFGVLLTCPSDVAIGTFALVAVAAIAGIHAVDVTPGLQDRPHVSGALAVVFMVAAVLALVELAVPVALGA